MTNCLVINILIETIKIFNICVVKSQILVYNKLVPICKYWFHKVNALQIYRHISIPIRLYLKSVCAYFISKWSLFRFPIDGIISEIVWFQWFIKFKVKTSIKGLFLLRKLVLRVLRGKRKLKLLIVVMKLHKTLNTNVRILKKVRVNSFK